MFKYSIILFFVLIFFSLSLQCSLQPKSKTLDTFIFRSHALKQFDLPFTVVYDGPILKYPKLAPLKFGFSHISQSCFTKNDLKFIPPDKRALIWTGIAYSLNNPWKKYLSPWGNDKSILLKNWNNRISLYKSIYKDINLNVDLLVLDIEARHESSKQILSLRNNTTTPEKLKHYNDQNFIHTYFRDIDSLYLASFEIAKKVTPNSTKISSYGDVPITRTWYGINKPLRSDTLTFSNYSIVRPFIDSLDFLSTSSYYFKDDARNLAYCLFQVETNKEYSNKPIIQFVWLRYSDDIENTINNSLAEATAIFPFFSGASGLWLWEKSNFKSKLDDNTVSTYKSFVNGLYRISKYKFYFIGDHTLIIPKSAKDHFIDKDPIWRGVVKNNKILIVAQNPYAIDSTETDITFSYKDWKMQTTLKGKMILLNEYYLDETTHPRLRFR